MYTQKTYSIGQFEVISVRNKRGIGIDFIPQKGGAIHQLYLGEHANPLLDPFLEGDDIEIDPLFKQALLFPFSSRLTAGKYSFEDNDYQFPINEKEKNCALHGFLYKENLEVSSIELEEEKAIVQLTYLYEGHFSYYPFPCKIQLTYSISESLFQFDFNIENTGRSTLPYGFGWHPYFKYKEDIKVKMDATNCQSVDKQGALNGEEYYFDGLSEYKVLDKKYDTCFKYIEQTPHTLLLGMGNAYELNLWQDETMGLIQLYTPGFNQIALEPLTSNINALNTNDGLIRLNPEESKHHRIKIKIS